MDILTKNEVVISGNKPSQGQATDKLRIMFCGTHYMQYNGYSRVVYELLRRLNSKEDLQITLFGFQNAYDGTSHREKIGANIKVIDALAMENPKRNGFGENEIAGYLKDNPQDILIIYNDMSVTSMLTQNIINSIGKPEGMRFVSYIDQVYLHQKPRYIDMLNKVYDHIIAFTDYWKEIIQGQAIRKDMKVDVLVHGFNHDMYYPVPRKIARAYFRMDPDTFYVLNLNRNQPRKRWDLCMVAWAEVIAKHQEKKKKSPKPIKLVIGTSPNGCWDLMEILERELGKRNISKDVIKDYIHIIDKPQQLDDKEINLLYSACDIGLNTCDGEGFGLCNFEHAAIGCPQVVPFLGGFRDFFNENTAKMVKPKYNLYVDNARDMIGGETEVSDPNDFANAIWDYFTSPHTVRQHGEKSRFEIIQHYEWNVIAEHFYKILKSIQAKPAMPFKTHEPITAYNRPPMQM